MSGSKEENLQVAKYYLTGIFKGVWNGTLRNPKFLALYSATVAYHLVQSEWSCCILTGAFCTTLKLSFILLLIVYHKDLYYNLCALPRDIRGITRFVRVLRTIRWAERNNQTVAKYLDQNAAKTPDKICFYFEEETWTYRQVEEMSNQVANYFVALGYGKGDVVALFMENRPEYVCIWLGLNKIGACAALINYNLRHKSLLHCIQTVNAKALVFGFELHDAVQDLFEINPALKELPIYSSGHGSLSLSDPFKDFEKEISKSSPVTPLQMAEMKLSDSLCYIYTSGTTGMPKAAVIKQYRLMMAANGVHFMNCVTDKDIVYNSLPLYHMTGGLIGVGQALLFGSSVVIRKRFSASQFWSDCIKYNVTVAQYLGETCRYLLAQPPGPLDKAHKVRLMSGNGLRREIWEEFVTRFGIKEMGEVYGSTEGNCNLASIDGQIGAVGFVPRFVYSVLPTALIKVDDATGEPIRDPETGLCIRCKPGEPGELMAKIVEKHPIRDFQGYTDKQSTNKKIVRNCFTQGDAVFRSGDIMVMDNLCYIYFKDRTGDTFRWKGENVSTTEVESVIMSCSDYKDVVVYGVKVPNTEGRAGMAAIADPDGCLDLNNVAAEIAKCLPVYARPLFIRVLDEVDTTGTYKLKKLRLQEEGYDIEKLKDPVYFYDQKSSKYIKFTLDLAKRLKNGDIRM